MMVVGGVKGESFQITAPASQMVVVGELYLNGHGCCCYRRLKRNGNRRWTGLHFRQLVLITSKHCSRQSSRTISQCRYLPFVLSKCSKYRLSARRTCFDSGSCVLVGNISQFVLEVLRQRVTPAFRHLAPTCHLPPSLLHSAKVPQQRVSPTSYICQVHRQVPQVRLARLALQCCPPYNLAQEASHPPDANCTTNLT